MLLKCYFYNDTKIIQIDLVVAEISSNYFGAVMLEQGPEPDVFSLRLKLH